MIGLLQRVCSASVRVDQEMVGTIGPGLVAFIGIERDDAWHNAQKLCDKLLGYRVFADASGRMNHSLREVGGGLLVVSQFTLAAQTGKGNRPGFDSAMPTQAAEKMFARLYAELDARYAPLAQGRFGADMQVSLVNDGPVTFWLRC